MIEAEDFNNVTWAASSSLLGGAKFSCQVLKIAVREYCVIEDTFFSELEDRHELEKSSLLYRNVELVLNDSLDNTRSARAQAQSSHDVLCNKTRAL